MVTKSRVVLFGSSADPKVKTSAAKLKKAGRNVQTQSFTSHPDGTGPCGLLCSCKEVCKNSVINEMVDVQETKNKGVYRPKRK
jgi:hypothetical protein